MIIQCENCDTKYKVSDTEIKENGRFVRCSYCAHEWVAYPSVDNQAKTEKPSFQLHANPFSLSIQADAKRKADLNLQLAPKNGKLILFARFSVYLIFISLGLIASHIILMNKGIDVLLSSQRITGFY